MEEGKLAAWHVKEGDAVRSGDVVAEIETDKATMEVESVDSGKVAKLLVPEGTEGVKVNTPIALVLGEGEAPGEEMPKPPAAPKAEPSMVSAEAPAPAPKAAAAPAAPVLQAAADPDLPAGVEMVEMTVRQALNEAMAEEMRRDPDIFLMGEEVAEYNGAYKVSQGLLDEFGNKRVIDTPITEHAFAGVGIGAAFAGLRPIVEFMTWNFAMQAIDQVINSAAKQLYMSGGQVHAPIVFRGPNGAASRVGAQHSQDYSSWYSHVPGLYVIAPFSAADAKGLLKAAIRCDDPVVFLENELLYGRNFELAQLDDHVLPIGKARIVREGKDVTVVSYSIGVGLALEAAETLAGEGIEAEVIDLRTLRPLDTEAILTSLAKTNRLVVAEEGWPTCSIASEVIAVCMEQGFDDLDAPVLRVCNEDVPLPYAANLEKLALIDSPRIAEAVRKVCYRA
jgi:pyruvate dehydrogenase E1 component beta subunit